MSAGGEILTVDQVADLYQLSIRTVYRHLDDGRLQGAKIGTTWRIRRDEAEAWFDSLIPARCERPERPQRPRRRPAQRGSLLSVLDGEGEAA